ncbi:MAG: DUF1579 domain-containing protein [Chitinophagaceae bacterium]
MSKLEASKTHGPHLQLSRLAGTWQGNMKTWFGPDNLVNETTISGTMRLIMDGQYVMHEYKSSFENKPFEGMAIYGYNIDLQRFESAWVDSFHTGTAIMFSEGEKGKNDFKMLGSYAYVTPDTEQHWGWRTHIDFVSDSEVVITAYNISPEGDESKATEIVYQRIN